MVFQKLNIDIVSQGEIEKMFLMPRESTTMSKVMTFLLTIKKEVQFGDKIMPYKVWSKKLRKKLSKWLKVYHAKKQNEVKVSILLIGIINCSKLIIFRHFHYNITFVIHFNYLIHYGLSDAKKKNKFFQVMKSLGIHPEFWTVVDKKNPLIENDYYQLPYKVKVWLVKVLCDRVTVS